MAHLLELAQLPQSDHVPEVNIGPAGIETLLQPQWPAGLQQLAQLFLDDDLGHAALQNAVVSRFAHATAFPRTARAFSTSFLI